MLPRYCLPFLVSPVTLGAVLQAVNSDPDGNSFPWDEHGDPKTRATADTDSKQKDEATAKL
eukprot:SAG31_NODE_23143_length_510_cov_0.890511_2_plen_60_part_01